MTQLFPFPDLSGTNQNIVAEIQREFQKIPASRSPRKRRRVMRRFWRRMGLA